MEQSLTLPSRLLMLTHWNNIKCFPTDKWCWNPCHFPAGRWCLINIGTISLLVLPTGKRCWNSCYFPTGCWCLIYIGPISSASQQVNDAEMMLPLPCRIVMLSLHWNNVNCFPTGKWSWNSATFLQVTDAEYTLVQSQVLPNR